MKIAAMSIVFNEEKLIRGCVEPLRSFVDKHYMIVGTTPFYSRAKFTKQDGSAELARKLGCDVIEGAFAREDVMRNYGMDSFAHNYDWIIWTDVDMWFEITTLQDVIDTLCETDAEVVRTPQYSYWKDTDHVLRDDDFCPVLAVRPSVRFETICNPRGNPKTVFLKEKCHHLAWCEPKDIYKKVMTYGHANEFDGEAWYKQYYLGWKEGEKAILPNKRFDVEYKPLPDELKEYLK